MHVTRRYFLKSTGAVVAYCGVAPLNVMAGEQVLAAAGGPGRVARGKTLVVIFLRGGADGLNLVVPFKDPSYYTLRQRLAVPLPGAPNGAVDLDGFFGLHPRAASLAPLFQSGLATALHAVGYAENTRSHFEEQDVWETGVIGNTIGSDGWLNRHLATSEGHGVVRAVSIGDTLPRILQGDAAAFALRGLDQLTLPGDASQQARIAAALEHAYRAEPREHLDAASDLLNQTGGITLDALQVLRGVSAGGYSTSVAYPETELGRKLKTVAQLIRADVGLEVAEVDYGGWDTHNNQGGVGGAFGNLVQGLADALAAMAADLEQRMDDVLVLTLSDFGRTAAENGTAGTDHGWANCMLALGGPVARAGGGQPRPVLTNWPGLAPEQLHQGRDLLHTTDFRDVLAEAVRVHLGNPHLETVLPGHAFSKVGLV